MKVLAFLTLCLFFVMPLSVSKADTGEVIFKARCGLCHQPPDAKMFKLKMAMNNTQVEHSPAIHRQMIACQA